MFCFKRKEHADGYKQKQLKNKSQMDPQKAVIILCKSSDSCALVYAIIFNKTAKTQANVSDQVILTENKIESVNQPHSVSLQTHACLNMNA